MSGLLFVAWIGFGAQIASARGQIHYPVKALSIANCECTVDTMALAANQTVSE